MMNRLIFFSFLIFINSCAYISNNFEKDILTENSVTPKAQSPITYCSNHTNKTNSVLVNADRKSQNDFHKMLKSIKRSYNISFAEEVVLWSLAQMNLRPDQSSPSAQIQFLMKVNGKQWYLNIQPNKTSGYSYLHGLESILKHYKSKLTLKQLGALYQRYHSTFINVSHNFEKFLMQQKKMIKQSKQLSFKYSRGGETLKAGEHFGKIDIRPAISHYLKNKTLFKKNNFLFTFNKKPSFIAYCNFDMSLYEDSIFLIQKETTTAHVFGLKSGNNLFMATSSLDKNSIKQDKQSYYFSSDHSVRNPALCSYSNIHKPMQALWLISTDSRDPGQHLFHLTEYGLSDIMHTKELDQMMRFSRHLFLKDPVRLVIESRRSSPEQMNKLLKLNLPIYNSRSLGKVLGLFHRKSDSSFILDDRRRDHISCLER